MAEAKRPPLHALTGMRAVAAFYVVAFHYAPLPAGASPTWLQHLVRMGFCAVGFFFVLSGFVLAYGYLDEHDATRGTKRDFWIARLGRIYPAFALAVALAAPDYVRRTIEASGLPNGLLRLGISLPFTLTLTQAWTPLTAVAWNGPGWSLSVEAFFYLLFPWALTRVRPRTAWQVLGACAVLWLAANAAPLAFTLTGPAASGAVQAAGVALDPHALATRVIQFNPLLRLPEFVLGVYLGKAFCRFRPSRDAGTYGRAFEAWLTPAALLLLTVALVYLGGRKDLDLLAHNGLLTPIYGALVWGLAAGTGPIERLLASRPLRLLGEASYAIYVLQEPVFTWFAWALVPGVSLINRRELPGPSFAGYVLVLVAVALAVHRWVEPVGRRWLTTWLRGATA